MKSGLFSSIKNYSYANARIRARRGNLITDQEYRKLGKMELAEIAEFMGNRGYGPEIEEMGDAYEGEDLIERAVRRNFSRTYQELMEIAPGPIQELLSIYSHKFDIENVKTVLRKVMRDPENDISEMVVPTTEIGRKDLERLADMGSPEEVMKEFEISDFDGDITDKIEDFSELGEIEDALDIYYYTHMVEKVDDIGGKSELFRKFLELEAGLKNISLVLRMKKRGYDYGDIVDRLIPVPARHELLESEELASLSYEEILEKLKESPAGDFIEEETSAEIQQALERYKLKQGIRLMHEDQLGLNPVLGYMVCKEVEAKNLRTIARAKAEGLGEEFIDRNLVKGVAS
ncbi:MAG: V-type ATPase subunit [Candidatus Nanohaloarchaeota archaeon QJJ-7]|nr:V-type ATPase subunit [Candidatus Nanohaloarchaeota archaeon QJJ-7]